MNKVVFLILGVFLIRCGSEDGNSDNQIIPKAKNDFVSIVEDTPTKLDNLLSNDELSSDTSVTSFDASSEKDGSLTKQSDNSFTYTPANSFVGNDTFNYTLCDTKNPPNCSTASVTLEVTDQGSPTVKNDAVLAIKNKQTVFKKLLLNDTLTDDAEVVSVDSSSSLGMVILNDDKTVSYTPLTNFEGADSFTYTVCDDDLPNPTCVTASVAITVVDAIAFNIPDNLQYYYGDAIFTSNPSNNLSVLSDLTRSNHTTILTYTQRHNYLYDADEDPSNPNNVVLIYSGESRFWKEYTSPTNSYTTQTFNTEHVYPKSLLSNELAETDLHHLRTCDSGINSDRSNRKFVNGSGGYKKSGSGWYPGDEWKGDVARMVFYLSIRYGELINGVGDMDVLLQWNVEDPVSDIENTRNNVIEIAQGNRNPFIDNPYLATLTWGGISAENRWN